MDRRCSFCGKKQGDVRLIAGPSDVYICHVCVALCAEVLAHEAATTGPGSDEAATTGPGEVAGSPPDPPGTGPASGTWIRSLISS